MLPQHSLLPRKCAHISRQNGPERLLTRSGTKAAIGRRVVFSRIYMTRFVWPYSVWVGDIMRQVEFSNRRITSRRDIQTPQPRGIVERLLSMVYIGGAYSLILAAILQAVVILSWIKPAPMP